MKEYLLKRALPFALTFVVGAAVGGFFQLFGARGDSPRRHYFGTYEGRRGCGKKFRRRHFAPDARPPVILFKPDARVPPDLDRSETMHGLKPARVRVTFGEDGKVRGAESLDRWSSEVSEAAERAARLIQFIPATADGSPTTVTEEVEIRFSF
jgi:Gram-negative bacterial TonB protein C-terminal